MRFAQTEQQQALQALSQAAAAAVQAPKKTRKHKYSSSCHHKNNPLQTTSSQPIPPPTVAVPVSVLCRGRSQSPPSSSSVVSSSPPSTSPQVHMVDSRVFQEVLNSDLAKRNPKRIGKIITDERFARLVIACGLPENDESITKSEREAIKYNKYVAGVDGRLFAWKPGCEKEDVTTAIWPTDMYEVVRFSDIARVISQEHFALGGAKGEKIWLSLREKYKGITIKNCLEFCRYCPDCAKSKVDKLVKKKKKIKAIIAKGAWYKVTIDLISMVNTPGGDGKWKYILTAIDHFSKWVYAWALESKTAEGVEAELRRMFMMFGYPVTMQSDNGSEFKGMVAELMKKNFIVYTHGQPYKPESQGVVERLNQTLENRLDSMMTQTGEKDWYNILDKAVQAYNNTPHSATKQTPYKILYGQDPYTRSATTIQQQQQQQEQEQEMEVEEEKKEEVKEEELAQKDTSTTNTSDEPPHVAIRREAHANYVAQAKRMETQHNKKRDNITAYSVGQYVSVPVRMGDHPNRLSHANIGGVIIQRTQHNSYRILTAHGMLGSPFMPSQFMLANSAQYPELWCHAPKWSSPEACEETVKNEPGYTMIEIHTMICDQTGITERLKQCKENNKKGKKEKEKEKEAKKGVNNTKGKEKEKGKQKAKGKGKGKGDSDSDSDSDSHSSSDSDCVSVDVGVGVDSDVGVGYAVPEQILDERVVGGIKQYKITWIGLDESKDSWQLASEYDDGIYDGAYIELVEEWERYKKTDPQYNTQTQTTTNKKNTQQATATATAATTTTGNSGSNSSNNNNNKPIATRKRKRSIEY